MPMDNRILVGIMEIMEIFSTHYTKKEYPEHNV